MRLWYWVHCTGRGGAFVAVAHQSATLTNAIRRDEAASSMSGSDTKGVADTFVRWIRGALSCVIHRDETSVSGSELSGNRVRLQECATGDGRTAWPQPAAKNPRPCKDRRMSTTDSRSIGRFKVVKGPRSYGQKTRTTGNSPVGAVNLLYAAIFLKFAAVPDSVTLFHADVTSSPRVWCLSRYRLGSGVFETGGGGLLLIPKTSQIWERD